MTRIQVDYSDQSGCVMPCPLCSHRVTTDTPIDAWRGLYTHLRTYHSSAAASALTEKTRKRIARLTWEIRQKESTPAR